MPFLAEIIWEEHIKGSSSALPTLKSLLADEIVPLDNVKSFLINQQIDRRKIPYEEIADDEFGKKKEANIEILSRYERPDEVKLREWIERAKVEHRRRGQVKVVKKEEVKVEAKPKMNIEDD
jgi:hypothetical protein